MAHNNLERLVELAQKTGDTLIVTDKSGHEPVVIMDVAKYEALLDVGYLANDSQVQYSETQERAPLPEEFEPLMETYEAPVPTTPVATEPTVHEIEEIPVEPIESAVEPVINESPGPEDEDGEERFYLEPIE